MPFITQGKANIKYLLIVVLIAVVAGGIIFVSLNFYRKEMLDLSKSAETKDPEAGIGDGVVCTMDAKLCPDGSSVGRIGPDCEFAACPGDEAVEMKSIIVDGSSTSVSSLGISLSLDRTEALSIARNLCNQKEQNGDKFQGEEFYGYIAELENNWFVNIKVLNCVCGVLINKTTGETTCFYTVPSNKLDKIKY